MKRYGFIRAAAATPSLIVADAASNGHRIAELYREAAAHGCAIVVFPELSITGSTCGSLFTQPTLLTGALNALEEILAAQLDTIAVIGLPLSVPGGIVSAAAVIQQGRILGIVPLKPLAGAPQQTESITLFGEEQLYGPLLFQCQDMPGFTFGIQPTAPGADCIEDSLCRSGAAIIAAPAASHEEAGSRTRRTAALSVRSAALNCGCIYAGAGEGESTTDLVFGGHRLILECGETLSDSGLYTTGLTISDLDLQLIAHRRTGLASGIAVPFFMGEGPKRLQRCIERYPFLPASGDEANDILDIQCRGLIKRVEHTRARRLIIGISGGLDSCLALLVAVRAMDLMDRSRREVLAVTMPCFGTTGRTRSNAEILCHELGVTFREIQIAGTVTKHFEDLGQDPETHDAAFENAQARERTQVLMDLANMESGLVVGTGDLSELALGWATYNGDHMSMYGVNAGAPKTLVRALVAQAAEEASPELRSVLLDILDTPVSPELLPAREDSISQVTEDLVGPYELHDFFIYNMLHNGFGPAKLLYLADEAFQDEYDSEIIHKWLVAFLRRFFSQQFKRSCLPDGPQLTPVSLSPRAGFRMPSDASAAMWLKDIE